MVVQIQPYFISEKFDLRTYIFTHTYIYYVLKGITRNAIDFTKILPFGTLIAPG